MVAWGFSLTIPVSISNCVLCGHVLTKLPVFVLVLSAAVVVLEPNPPRPAATPPQAGDFEDDDEDDGVVGLTALA